MKYCFHKKEFIELEINPDKLAVYGSNGHYSWQVFNDKVQELINFFKINQLDTDHSPILIYGHKSADMVVAIYACMTMNIPYIPVDLVYPDNRVKKIIASSGCNLIINTSNRSLDHFSTTEIKMERSVQLIERPKQHAPQLANPLDLVYIIFTSGSTGEPKGVQISHEAVRSFTKWMTSSDYGFTANDVFINTALLSFDLSVFELMTFSATGGSLILNTKEEAGNPDILLNKIKTLNGSVWVSTPSFAFLYSRLDKDERLNSVHTFLFCGEVLPHNLAGELISKYQLAKVINTYGPTEATVATTILQITPEILEKYNPLPVGYSKMDSQIIIEEEEIIIVGPNVSVGYINRPDLNPQKFLTINNERAFKTGDKGYLKDNLLFFHGRNG